MGHVSPSTIWNRLGKQLLLRNSHRGPPLAKYDHTFNKNAFQWDAYPPLQWPSLLPRTHLPCTPSNMYAPLPCMPPLPCMAPCHACPPCGQTDACENITFPQLLLRAVNISALLCLVYISSPCVFDKFIHVANENIGIFVFKKGSGNLVVWLQ